MYKSYQNNRPRSQTPLNDSSVLPSNPSRSQSGTGKIVSWIGKKLYNHIEIVCVLVTCPNIFKMGVQTEPQKVLVEQSIAVVCVGFNNLELLEMGGAFEMGGFDNMP